MARLRNVSEIRGGSSIPVGTVLPFAGSSAPDGYLFCDGSAVSRSTYSALYALINTIYGAGDGSTTFNLPDLRRRFIYGKGISESLGANDGLVEGSRSLNHTHTVAAHYHSMGAGSDLAIGSSGSHITSISHDHGSIISGAGSAHNHGNGTLSTGPGSTHSHGLGTLTTLATTHSHNNTLSINNDGSHTHTLGYSSGDVVPTSGLKNPADVFIGEPLIFSGGSTPKITSAHNGHTHSISGSITAENTHTHGLTGSLASEGNHTHSISGTIASESAHTHSVVVPALNANSLSDGLHSHSSSSISGKIGLVTGGQDGNNTITSGSSGIQAYIVLNYIIKY